MTKTDSVAVLREACEGLLAFIREKYPDDFKDGGRGYICPHHIAISQALAALSAQGEAYCYVGIGPMRGGPRDGTDDVRWYYESPAAAEYHGCHTIFPLYTAPGGVGDAVTEAAYRWWLSRRPLDFSEADHLASPTVNTHSDTEKALAEALAARTGKGEANG